MNPLAIAYQSPVIPLLGCCLRQPWIPGNRHADFAIVCERHDHALTLKPNRARTGGNLKIG